MNFGDGFVVRFANDEKNGGKLKIFDNFVDGGKHDVGGIDHRSMLDEGEIQISNN